MRVDVVNFKAGSKTVALPILDILLTEQLGEHFVTVPGDDPDLIGVKDYLGVSTPIFDLVSMLEGEPTEASMDRLLAVLRQGGSLTSQQRRLARRLAEIRPAESDDLLLARLEEAREQLKPVLVYTTRDGVNPMLGFVVDLVADTLSVDDQGIQPLTDTLALLPQISARTKSLLSGLITQPDEDPAILLNPQKFSLGVEQIEMQ